MAETAQSSAPGAHGYGSDDHNLSPERNTFWAELGDLQGMFTASVDENMQDPTVFPNWALVESREFGLIKQIRAVMDRSNWWHATRAVAAPVVRFSVAPTLPSPGDMHAGQTSPGGVSMTKGAEPPGCANRDLKSAAIVLSTRPWLLQTLIAIALMEFILWGEATLSEVTLADRCEWVSTLPLLTNTCTMLLVAHAGEPLSFFLGILLSVRNGEWGRGIISLVVLIPAMVIYQLLGSAMMTGPRLLIAAHLTMTMVTALPNDDGGWFPFAARGTKSVRPGPLVQRRVVTSVALAMATLGTLPAYWPVLILVIGLFDTYCASVRFGASRRLRRFEDCIVIGVNSPLDYMARSACTPNVAAGAIGMPLLLTHLLTVMAADGHFRAALLSSCLLSSFIFMHQLGLEVGITRGSGLPFYQVAEATWTHLNCRVTDAAGARLGVVAARAHHDTPVDVPPMPPQFIEVLPLWCWIVSRVCRLPVDTITVASVNSECMPTPSERLGVRTYWLLRHSTLSASDDRRAMIRGESSLSPLALASSYAMECTGLLSAMQSQHWGLIDHIHFSGVVLAAVCTNLRWMRAHSMAPSPLRMFPELNRPRRNPEAVAWLTWTRTPGLAYRPLAVHNGINSEASLSEMAADASSKLFPSTTTARSDKTGRVRGENLYRPEPFGTEGLYCDPHPAVHAEEVFWQLQYIYGPPKCMTRDPYDDDEGFQYDEEVEDLAFQCTPLLAPPGSTQHSPSGPSTPLNEMEDTGAAHGDSQSSNPQRTFLGHQGAPPCGASDESTITTELHAGPCELAGHILTKHVHTGPHDVLNDQATACGGSAARSSASSSESGPTAHALPSSDAPEQEGALANPVPLRLALRAFKHASSDASLSGAHDQFILVTDFSCPLGTPVDRACMAMLFSELARSPLAIIRHGKVAFDTVSPAPVRAAWLTGHDFSVLGIVVNVGSVGTKTVRITSKKLRGVRRGEASPPMATGIRSLRNPGRVMRYLDTVVKASPPFSGEGTSQENCRHADEATTSIRSMSNGMVRVNDESLATLARSTSSTVLEVHDDGQLTGLLDHPHTKEVLIWHRGTKLLWWGEGPKGAPSELLIGIRWLSRTGIVQHM